MRLLESFIKKKNKEITSIIVFSKKKKKIKFTYI